MEFFCYIFFISYTHKPEVYDFIPLIRYDLCNMYTCSGNSTQERAVQDLPCLVDLYLVYLI